MNVQFTEEAEHEMLDASLWYDSRESGLSQRFRDEVAHVVGRISDDPTLWRMREGGDIGA